MSGTDEIDEDFYRGAWETFPNGERSYRVRRLLSPADEAPAWLPVARIASLPPPVITPLLRTTFLLGAAVGMVFGSVQAGVIVWLTAIGVL